MTMPENKAIARPITDRPGHYRATGVFTMGGDWEIEAIAAHDHRPASGRQRVTVRL